MKVLITGNKGFIGRNLCEALIKKPGIEILPFDKDTDASLLKEYTKQCDFVYHLAAVHRPPTASEFDSINRVFFEDVLALIQEYENPCPVLLTSSVHAGTDSVYGKSKIAAEEALRKHSAIMNSRAIIYRLTNTFGRYALPNHHSVVANFCHSIANNYPVIINEPDRLIRFYYIDDVVDSFKIHLEKDIEPPGHGFFALPEGLTYTIRLKDLAELLYRYKSLTDQGIKYMLEDEFSRKLYDTFLSYLQDITANANE